MTTVLTLRQRLREYAAIRGEDMMCSVSRYELVAMLDALDRAEGDYHAAVSLLRDGRTKAAGETLVEGLAALREVVGHG